MNEELELIKELSDFATASDFLLLSTTPILQPRFICQQKPNRLYELLHGGSNFS